MLSRRALIVADAAGPEETFAPVLKRFGFASIARAHDFDEALAIVRSSPIDLVVLPIQDLTPVQLTTIERQMRAERHTVVIGTAPRLDPELILRAMRSGIQEFVVCPPDASELAGAVDRVMRRVPAEQQAGRVVAVYSSKGGVGNTSIAVNLADAFARNHPNGRVALVDLVVEGGDVRVFLNLKSSYHLGDLVEKLDRVDAELLSSLLTPTPGGVWVLPGPDDPELDDVLDANTIAAMIRQLRTHFAFTLLDCEHHLSERTLAALDAADRIVLVTQLNVPALRSAQRTLEICKRLGYASDKVMVVVNRFQLDDVLSIKDAEKVLGAEVFQSLPNDYQLSTSALTRGVSLAQADPDSKLSLAFDKLASRLGGASVEPAVVEAPIGRPGLRRLFVRRRRA
jgi:pilus assembly protein CpaE